MVLTKEYRICMPMTVDEVNNLIIFMSNDGYFILNSHFSTKLGNFI